MLGAANDGSEPKLTDSAVRTNGGFRDTATKCDKTTALIEWMVSRHNPFGIEGDKPVLSPDAAPEFRTAHQAIDFVPIPRTIAHPAQVRHR